MINNDNNFQTQLETTTNNNQQIENSSEFNQSLQNENIFNIEKAGKHKTSKKKKIGIILWWTSIITIIICIIAIIYQLSSSPRGLFNSEDLEEKLNNAYEDIWDFIGQDHNKKLEIEIENVNESTHDQTFECDVLRFGNDDITGYTCIGLINKGKVIQIQSILIAYEDSFNSLSTEEQEAIISFTLLPIRIFKNDIDTLSELFDFLTNMKQVESEQGKKFIIVSDNIEYTFSLGMGNGIVIGLFTIRYLPAFSCGFYEES